jgi:hypothetical protein
LEKPSPSAVTPVSSWTSSGEKPASNRLSYDLLLIPQSFDYLAAFHLQLLQAILFIAV